MKTEARAVNILLERGVKVPMPAPLFLRIFFKKINLIIKAPTLATLSLIAGKYIQLGIKDTNDLTVIDGFELLKKHQKKMSEIIALTILNNRYKYWLCKPLAYYLRGNLPANELMYIFQLIVLYGGVEDFINTIRLTEATRITMPMNLSPEEKTS